MTWKGKESSFINFLGCLRGALAPLPKLLLPSLSIRGRGTKGIGLLKKVDKINKIVYTEIWYT
jgi:hypothetical protein